MLLYGYQVSFAYLVFYSCLPVICWSMYVSKCTCPIMQVHACPYLQYIPRLSYISLVYSYLVCCTHLVSACMSIVFYTYFSVLSYLAIVHHTYSLCVVCSLHCLISLPVSCWSLPIACLLYMPIQFATPSKPPIYAPIVFYP